MEYEYCKNPYANDNDNNSSYEEYIIYIILLLT